ncbi:YtpI family protein [Paenibacillus sp. MBLB4367]|uniref:YtpI family protein n=1 Tax=Paenibacillus sp. MBLB4367 TaxID=3384767 RepID=UPI00390817A9
MAWYQFVITIVIVASLGFSVFYSFRYRMQKEPQARGLYAARMNIWMGILLISLALVQLFLFEMNTVRLVIGAVLLLIGLFNLFAGLRNQSHFRALKR